MAAADCTLGALPFRIETASGYHTATLTGVIGTIANSSTVNIEVKFALIGAATPGDTGSAVTQTEGEITLYPNQTFAITKNYSAFSYKSASASEITWGPY